MTNFAEKYPACADCPSLQLLQAKRDAKAQYLEGLLIDETFKKVAAEEFIEQQRVELDQSYVSVLDEVDEHGLPTIHADTARETYEEMNVMLSSLTPNDKNPGEDDRRMNFLTSLDDEDAELLTYSCHGPLKISVLAFHKTICATRLKNSFGIYTEPPHPPTRHGF